LHHTGSQEVISVAVPEDPEEQPEEQEQDVPEADQETSFWIAKAKVLNQAVYGSTGSYVLVLISHELINMTKTRRFFVL
jgi:hypothetical protein